MLRTNSDAEVPRVVPAQVNFLTIYNPLLGDTEETERDQIVFWGSKNELLKQHRQVRSRAKTLDRGGSAAGEADPDGSEGDKPKTEDELYNERLRHVGLARGMVDFAKDFSGDKSVSTIETAKSRIVLHEIESGWWILASIDLTRLPSTQTPQTLGQKNGTPSSRVEHSSREVAPPQLLIAQLLRAHRIFLLHHAATLWDLYNRLGRPRFCALLQKYWEGFLWDWDVLLHGSPATEIYGACVKLAGGGELGVGVGEEEWGSGEREVIESFVGRIQGCADLVIGRYGQAPRQSKNPDSEAKEEAEIQEQDLDQEPWLGNGEDPGPADGIIFSGIGTLSRRSLATVSQWMEAIFKYGDNAYGVGESPSARPRPKRRPQRPKTARRISDDPRKPQDQTSKEREPSSQGHGREPHPRFKSPIGKAPDLRRQAMENNATPPGIPAPLVGAVERSLDEALAKAAQRTSSRSPQGSPKHERTEEQAMRRANDQSSSSQSDAGSNSSWFDTDKMAKVLTLGYGSSWTLNPKGFADRSLKNDAADKPGNSQAADLIDFEDSGPKNAKPTKTAKMTSTPDDGEASPNPTQSTPAEERLQEVDPTPEVSDEDEKPFIQRLEKSIGKFLVGLSGDLENMEIDADDDPSTDSPSPISSQAQRIVLRTLTVEVARPVHRPSIASANSVFSQLSRVSAGSRESDNRPEPKTSAAASIDGPAQQMTHNEKMQVAVYVHQPFIFVFLFSLHTPNLTMPQFYRSIHHQLGPLQGPLLTRTDPEIVAQRIKDVISSRAEDVSSSLTSSLEKAANGAGNTIYDLIFDPAKLTIRTSLPNIPVPTAFADSNSSMKSTMVSGSWYTLGIPIGSAASSTSRQPPSTKSLQSRAEQWTRTDALNVHTQMLNLFTSTHSDFRNYVTATRHQGIAPTLRDTELERTVKTNRGWWVLWMRVAAPPSTDTDSKDPSPVDTESSKAEKEAFLVRKSNDSALHKASTASKLSKPSAGRWLLREQSRDVNSGHSTSSSAAGGSGGAKSVSEGVGVDARKWVQGLLHLSM